MKLLPLSPNTVHSDSRWDWNGAGYPGLWRCASEVLSECHVDNWCWSSGEGNRLYAQRM